MHHKWTHGQKFQLIITKPGAECSHLANWKFQQSHNTDTF
jgi:hypothetical protein